jgi:spore cortex formation protein SpoVR/YcgB (stage V sporulation)
LPAGVEPPGAPPVVDPEDEFSGEMKLPEENLLYFIEKNSPSLRAWQRETLRIVRNLSQYFYPQRQLKVMNEGCATFVHYTIMNTLFDRGLITEGSWMEFMHSHTSVVFQPEFNDRRYSGFNPYALGYGMMADIRRICEEPTAEDRDWFPEFAGNGDWVGTLKSAWANYRDESFIEQFLSPKLMRDFRLFALYDKADEGAYKVSAIHNESGYRSVRSKLARQYDAGMADPNIQVVGADLKGDRTLQLAHVMNRGVPLHNQTKELVLAHVERLWGHDVKLEEQAA